MMKYCLSPRVIPQTQAIFHCIPLPSSQYSMRDLIVISMTSSPPPPPQDDRPLAVPGVWQHPEGLQAGHSDHDRLQGSALHTQLGLQVHPLQEGMCNSARSRFDKNILMNICLWFSQYKSKHLSESKISYVSKLRMLAKQHSDVMSDFCGHKVCLWSNFYTYISVLY